MKRRVLLIALDGATPAIVSPLLDRGELPHLQRIVEKGSLGTLAASSPLVRAMVWTTLATGTCAPKHGVCGDVAVRVDGAGLQPTDHGAWHARAMWELLSAAGYSCATVGWPATTPATSWDAGLLIDSVFAEPLGPGFDAWPLLPDCVAPPTRRDELRPLRVHPGDITGEQIAGFVPDGRLVDQDNDPRLTRIAVALARTATVHAAATHIATACEWDFLAVAYPLLAELQHEFLRYRSPRLPALDDTEIAIYAQVVDVAYRVQDAMLGTLLKSVDESTTVIIVSPYGFAAGADRPDAKTVARSPPAIAWHRNPGILAAAGKGIQVDALVHGARVQDIAPTILELFGLRSAEHDGRCIEALSRSASAPREISLPAPVDEASVDVAIDPGGADLEPAQRQAIENVKIAWLVNTAEAHLAAGDYAQAADCYARLAEGSPQDWLAKARLARCYLNLGELEKCRSVAAEVVATNPDLPWGYLLGAAGLVLGGQAEEADSYLAQAHELGRGLPNVSLRLGVLHLLCQDWEKAEALFREALRMIPRSVEAHDGLGCALYAQKRHHEAIATFKAGLGHTFHFPLAHLHLAMVLDSIGQGEDALSAARTALSQDPAVPGGEALLERILSRGTRG